MIKEYSRKLENQNKMYEILPQFDALNLRIFVYSTVCLEHAKHSPSIKIIKRMRGDTKQK